MRVARAGSVSLLLATMWLAAGAVPASAVVSTDTQSCPGVINAPAEQHGPNDLVREVQESANAFQLTFQWGPFNGPAPTQAFVLCAWVDSSNDATYHAGEQLFGVTGTTSFPAETGITVGANAGASVCARAAPVGADGTPNGNATSVACTVMGIFRPGASFRGASVDRATGDCAQVFSAQRARSGVGDTLVTFYDQRDNHNGSVSLAYREYTLAGAGGQPVLIDYQTCLWVDNDADNTWQTSEPLFGAVEQRSPGATDYFAPYLSATVTAKPGDIVCAMVAERPDGTGQRYAFASNPSCTVIKGAYPVFPLRELGVRSDGGGAGPNAPSRQGLSTGGGRVGGKGNYDPAASGHPAPSIPVALRAPAEVSFAPIDLLRSAVLTAGLLILVGFPSQLFNSTLSAHYDEVMGWFGFLRRRRRKEPERGDEGKLERAAGDIVDDLPQTSPWVIGGVFLFSAFIGGFLDPKFGFDVASLQAVVGILLTIAVTTLVYTGFSALLLHRLYHRWGRFRVFPGGVAIAAACVVVSKVTHAQPGYVYGVMLSYTLGKKFEVPKRHQGALVATSCALVLVVSLLAWFAFGGVKTAAASQNLFLVLLAGTLSSIFLGGMCSLVFGLIPLRFLDGEKLLQWQRLAWGALFALALFLFVHVVLNNVAGSSPPGRSYVVAVTFFVIFGLLSVAFWAYFRFRQPGVST